MDKLSREDVVRLRTRIDDALSIIGQVTGLAVSIDNVRFGPHHSTFNVSITPLGIAGGTFEHSQDGIAFRNRALSVGLSPDDLGRKLDYYGRHTYTIIGWNTKAPKNPIILRRDDNNNVFRVNPSFVKSMLERTVRTNASQT